ncbi:MAG: hypothetical protein HY452_00455 [Parcubacteria group bacterium]|nr:hypothetical protein [Parcubacteria group bacterium]
MFFLFFLFFLILLMCACYGAVKNDTDNKESKSYGRINFSNSFNNRKNNKKCQYNHNPIHESPPFQDFKELS